MNLEFVIQKYVDGQDLTSGERRFLMLAMNADKVEVARFRISKAEKLLIKCEAEQEGLSFSEHLRNLTVKRKSLSPTNGNPDGTENN
ncbi:MAG: hypothetical protein K8R77_16780 [Anaerolineaceae bacterium]|nr:hypothetical protein [Anaerolineaceae bacterium]